MVLLIIGNIKKIFQIIKTRHRVWFSRQSLANDKINISKNQRSKNKRLFTIILIFSKKVLVGAIIVFKSKSTNINQMDQDSHFGLSRPPQVFLSRAKSCDSFSDISGLRKDIREYILNLQGGSTRDSNYDIFELNKMEDLRDSIISKTPQRLKQQNSINKILQKILKGISIIAYPVILKSDFWKILSVLVDPHHPYEPFEPDEVIWTESSKKSGIFAKAMIIPPPQKKHYLIRPMTNNPIENSFSPGLTASGLSTNHASLGEQLQNIEIKTRLRRAQPLYPSEVLGDFFQYGGKQLERKAPGHLPDFGVSIEGKSLEQMASEYKDLVETILGKQGLVRKDGTLSKQEPTINIGDPETRGIVVFENNPLYDNYHFISSYPISEEAFDHFVKTGEIGLSPEEREEEINELQRIQAKAEREKENARSFYRNLPENARISNKQLREAEALQKQLEVDPNFEPTDNQKKLLQRAEKYQRYKTEFEKNKKDEL